MTISGQCENINLDMAQIWKYFSQGTMLNPIDLQRVAVEKAAAVLVLCDKFSRDPCERQLLDKN